MSDNGFDSSNGGDDERTNNYEMEDSTINRALDALASQPRRYALKELCDTADGVATVDDLADHHVEQVPDAADRDRVKVALYHHILPKLDDANFIDFDPRTDTARYHGDELIEDLLDFIAKRKE